MDCLHNRDLFGQTLWGLQIPALLFSISFQVNAPKHRRAFYHIDLEAAYILGWPEGLPCGDEAQVEERTPRYELPETAYLH